MCAVRAVGQASTGRKQPGLSPADPAAEGPWMLMLWVPSEPRLQDRRFPSPWGSPGRALSLQQSRTVNVGARFREERTEIQRFAVVCVRVHHQEDPPTSPWIFSS